jgi:hypothetical protein
MTSGLKGLYLNTFGNNRHVDLAGFKICSLLLLIGCLLLASCGGKKEVKQVSPDAKLSQEAFALADTLKNAYEKKDREALKEDSTETGYADLAGQMKAFESATLTFTPTWVEIRDSKVYLTVSWIGAWTVKGKVSEERGIAIFVLEGKPLRLARIQRSNPFSQPE